MSTSLAACQAPSRLINDVSKADAALSTSIPRINCSASLSPAEDLTRSVVAERVREGSYYAALAQIQGLPASVPVVAVLRADILRRLKSPEAQQWYLAMRDRCVSADADHGLGLLAAEAGEHAMAHRYLQKAAKARPNDANFRNDLGFSAMLISNDQQAEFELRTSFELAREDRTPGFNLMLLSLIKGDRASWWRWRERLSPTEAERLDLLKGCREMMRQRQTLGGTASAQQQNCPINPLS
ncbi:MAG: hypothetical protein ABIR53_03810 [Paraperlucidibaca sp.]